MERNQQSPLLRYYQYSKERFPLKHFIPLSVIFSASASIGTQIYIYGKFKDLSFIFLAFLAMLFCFLRLRLFDEFKDSQHDSQYYPARPISRGLVELKELNSIIFPVLFFELIIAASKGIESLSLFFVFLIYSLLMLKEFFVKDWLRTHFTAYILSHEILLFPLFFYIYSLNGLTFSWISQPYFWLLTIFLGSQLFLLEITRKIRPKDLEIASRDTYTAQYGIKRTSLLVSFLGLIIILFGISAEKILHEKISILNYISLIILVEFLFLVLRFIRQPSEINAKKVFNFSILFVLVVNFVFIATILIF